MDRLDEFEVFLAILDTGSLVGASRKLGRSAPAITRLLASLEERVGTRLLERTTRNLAATEAGLRLAGQARQVLSLYEAAVIDDADELVAAHRAHLHQDHARRAVVRMRDASDRRQQREQQHGRQRQPGECMLEPAAGDHRNSLFGPARN